MRTRRSVRNQNILFTALFKPKAAPLQKETKPRLRAHCQFLASDLCRISEEAAPGTCSLGLLEDGGQ